MNFLKNKKIMMITAGVAVGLCLILAGSLQNSNDKISDIEQKELYSSEELTVYTEKLEKRVEDIIENIAGVKDADVLITFESSKENVYASNGENSDFVIIQNSDGSESGIKLMEINAKVRGIAVVCDYSGNEKLRAEIIEMLTSLFNVGSNRISVMPSK